MTAAVDIGQCVYGPVPSRRLGRSLGVDLVPFKTCTFDCAYCQLGRTTDLRVDRRVWVDPSAVLARVRERLAAAPDIITIAGSGEPTLHTGLGEVVRGIKAMTDIPLAVLTNGSLLGEAVVQHDLAEADIVIPSLDAPDEDLFRLVNRPHPSLRFADVVAGMVAFREAYRGRIWLEVMLLGGVTGMPSEVRRLAAVAATIRPDRIQLNTVVRPPAESFVSPVARPRLDEFAALFVPAADVVAPAVRTITGLAVDRADVLALIAHRPCTVGDVAAGLGIHRSQAIKALAALTAEGSASHSIHDGRLFYAAAETAGSQPREESRR